MGRIISWRAKSLIAEARRAGIAEGEQQMDITLQLAKGITPINKDPNMQWHAGTLMRSGKVISEHPRSGEHARILVRFGVDNEPFNYAELQHDNLIFEHEPPGQAMYLAVPFKHYMSLQGVQKTAAAMRRAVRSMP
jgi:hypothetical protein